MPRTDDALEYHTRGRPGKLEVTPTKQLVTQRDLSLAYSPGVAQPCLEIDKDPETNWLYTARGNLVAVVSNGTAVLGLGNIGALAGKPVMEGKACLFKKFADIDVFDIEIDETNVDKLVEIVAALEPTFGGINLEDIKAPECFEVEARLKERMSIPVFHDDQHGTAIISGAALLNACELSERKLEDSTVVVSGAGASAIACAAFFIDLGIKRENITLVDSRGVVYDGRGNLNRYKEMFAQPDSGARTLADAMKGCDVFLGCSVAGLVTKKMVKSMADKPIVFALANPDPEISYPDAKEARDDAFVATGRSDYPNQVNNVLGFPFIFRGALDVRASAVNEQMKVAAAHALAELAHEPVPESVTRAYAGRRLRFGPDYLIPTPFDPRVLWWEAPAVAKAAMDSGVARIQVDIEEYKDALKRRHGGTTYSVMRTVVQSAQADPKTLVFPEADKPKILRACESIYDSGIAKPILLGNKGDIMRTADELGLTEFVERVGVTELEHSGERRHVYAQRLFEIRRRKGMTLGEARELLTRPAYWAMMMLEQDQAAGVVTGLNYSYGDTIRPALQIIGLKPGVKHAAGMHMMVLKDKVMFFADATVNVDPDAETLAEIAIQIAEAVETFGIEPRVAMISYSNFGTHNHASPNKARQAVKIAHERRPDLEIDGEMQADFALVKENLDDLYPFSRLTDAANVLIFPSLTAANAAYKVLQSVGGATAVGPILLGMNKPVAALQREVTVEEIINLAAYTVKMAQEAEEEEEEA